MTPENMLVLLILAAAIVLFISEKLRPDIVAMLVLLALILTGLLTTAEAFAGFANPAVVTVWSVFIISGALVRSGVTDRLCRYMMRLAGRSEARLIAVIMLTVGGMSAFMNNIGAVAILLPAVIGVARQINIAPSKLLIPLAFASLLGGNMTLIGTPPNILAAGLLENYAHLPGFSFFDFTPTGVLMLGVGIVYMVLLGRRLLPERTPGGELSRAYPIREYLAEVRVGEDSPVVGSTVADTRFGEEYSVNVLQIRRDNGAVLRPLPDRRLQAGDVLLMEGAPDNILTVSEAQKLEPLPTWKFGPFEEGDGDEPRDLQLVEVTLAPNSILDGKTLKEADFRARYGLNVIAMRRHGRSFVTALANVRLQFGDALLLEGPANRINQLRSSTNFLVLDTPPLEAPSARRLQRARLAVAIMVGVLIVISLGLLETAPAMLIGAVLVVMTGLVTMDEAYRSIEWRSIFLIAGLLPLGTAMEQTGTALFLANLVIDIVGGLGPLGVMMGIFLLTALLTEGMSNAAATVLVVPIAIDAARSLGVNPHAFVMAVVLAASTSFLMPVGHQANVIVMGPGGYRFTDYTRVGLWLNVIIFFMVLIFLPIIWPL